MEKAVQLGREDLAPDHRVFVDQQIGQDAGLTGGVVGDLIGITLGPLSSVLFQVKALAGLEGRVWNSIAEQEAAYLLLPYTEQNRQTVERLLDERFAEFLETEFVDDPEERVARAAEGKPAVIPDWDGPLFCYASDRVAQDGCKVQIMDRLFPEREDMGWESGWAFYSGDEGDVYGEGDEYYESHCGFYDIRDICRIDPDIIPLLNLPYGTMQMRGEDGAWYEVIRDDEGEEET